MTTLYLVRHGETVDNLNRIMQGQTGGTLTAEGVRQAERLRERFSAEAIEVFYASDLKRAVDTCRIIAEPHGKPVLTTPLLRERDWGSFTGRYIPDLRDAEWTDDIETVGAMKARAGRFLEMLRASCDGKTVLAVGHGIINKALQSVFRGVPMSDVVKMENAEVRVLHI